MRSASSRARAGGIPRIAAATPTPAGAAGRCFGQPATGALANGATAANGSRPPATRSDVFKSRPIQPAKRRQSFKPRQSLAAGLLRGVALDEADEADDDDDLY